jgi:hypothetical protein
MHKLFQFIFFCVSSCYLSSCATSSSNNYSAREPIIPNEVIEDDGVIAGISFFESAPLDFKPSSNEKIHKFLDYYVKRNHNGYDFVYLGCGTGKDKPVYSIKLIKFVPKFPTYLLDSTAISYKKKIDERLGIKHKNLTSTSGSDGIYYWTINSRQHYLENPSKYQREAAISNYFTSVSLYKFRMENCDKDLIQVEVHSKKIKELQEKQHTYKESQISF